jgi:hypothetical protein
MKNGILVLPIDRAATFNGIAAMMPMSSAA